VAKKAKPGGFDQKKGVRRIARERIGTVPPSHPIEPKDKRKRPKHKKPLEQDIPEL
jgi:hypothetical protein